MSRFVFNLRSIDAAAGAVRTASRDLELASQSVGRATSMMSLPPDIATAVAAACRQAGRGLADASDGLAEEAGRLRNRRARIAHAVSGASAFKGSNAVRWVKIAKGEWVQLRGEKHLTPTERRTLRAKLRVARMKRWLGLVPGDARVLLSLREVAAGLEKHHIRLDKALKRLPNGSWLMRRPVWRDGRLVFLAGTGRLTTGDLGSDRAFKRAMARAGKSGGVVLDAARRLDKHVPGPVRKAGKFVPIAGAGLDALDSYDKTDKWLNDRPYLNRGNWYDPIRQIADDAADGTSAIGAYSHTAANLPVATVPGEVLGYSLDGVSYGIRAGTYVVGNGYHIGEDVLSAAKGKAKDAYGWLKKKKPW